MNLIEDLKHVSSTVGLEVYISKTKIMSPIGERLEIQGQIIENLAQYIYLEDSKADKRKSNGGDWQKNSFYLGGFWEASILKIPIWP